MDSAAPSTMVVDLRLRQVAKFQEGAADQADAWSEIQARYTAMSKPEALRELARLLLELHRRRER